MPDTDVKAADMDISIREGIRWVPDPFTEPTSTLVLTSPGKHFVDVRILKPLDSNNTTSDKPRLDWAFAGRSESTPRIDTDKGLAYSHSVWKHWIDSKTEDAEGVVDEGDMLGREDGTTLEKGRMVNPATGVEGEYEEVWRTEEVAAGAEGTYAVLHRKDGGDGCGGMVVRVGQFVQGVYVMGGQGELAGRVCVQRWEWERGNGWREVLRVGLETGRGELDQMVRVITGGLSPRELEGFRMKEGRSIFYRRAPSVEESEASEWEVLELGGDEDGVLPAWAPEA